MSCGITAWRRTDVEPKMKWWAMNWRRDRFREFETHAEAVAHLDGGVGEIKRNPNKDITFWRNYDDGRPAVQVDSPEADAAAHGLEYLNTKFGWEAVHKDVK